MMAMLSAIPGLGHALVWVPVTIYLAADGPVGRVHRAARVVRGRGGLGRQLPAALAGGQRHQLPDLVILLSTLGGLVLFGPLGFIVGPIVAALFVTVWELYGAAFADLLPPASLPVARFRRGVLQYDTAARRSRGARSQFEDEPEVGTRCALAACVLAAFTCPRL